MLGLAVFLNKRFGRDVVARLLAKLEHLDGIRSNDMDMAAGETIRV